VFPALGISVLVEQVVPWSVQTWFDRDPTFQCDTDPDESFESAPVLRAGTVFLVGWRSGTVWQVVHRKWDVEGCPTLCTSYVIGEDPPPCGSGALIRLIAAMSN
jgi:hypothetical protein